VFDATSDAETRLWGYQRRLVQHSVVDETSDAEARLVWLGFLLASSASLLSAVRSLLTEARRRRGGLLLTTEFVK
jgi:hypothetical protein